MTVPAVFETCDLVQGWGQVVQDGDGVWLDLSRVDSLNFGPRRRGRNSIRLLDADVSLVPTEFGPNNAIPGAATVTGRWLGDAIAVTEVSAARPADPTYALWRSPPCPPPPGGWPHGMNGAADDNPTFDVGDLEATGAAVTVVIFRPGPDQAIVVVAASDPELVRARLGPQLPRRLCVVTSRWTRQQLNDVLSAARDHWQDWGVELMHELADDNAQAHIEIELVRVTAEIAAWAATLPDGILTLDPILTPRH